MVEVAPSPERPPLKGQGSSAPYPSRRYAWFVVAVLVVAALVAFIDRQVVAIVVDPMKADLGVGDAQIGWLYGVFAIFYALAALPIAWLADRKSRKAIIALGIFFWSLMTMACGLSRAFWHVLLARIGVGVGEATLSPATTSLIGDLFPRQQVPLAMSVFQMGPIMGSGIAFIIGGYVLGLVEQAAPLVLPFFGPLAPWQQTFFYLGAPGLLVALLFALLREPARRQRGTQGVKSTVGDNAASVLKPAASEVPTVGMNSAADAQTEADLPADGAAAGAGFHGFGEIVQFYRQHLATLALHHLGFLSLVLAGYAFVFWTVSFFVRVHGYEASEASLIFGWIFLIAGPLGPIAVALLARRLSDAGRRDANILAGMVGGFGAIVTILIIQFAPNALWAFVLYAPAMMLINSPFGIAAGALPVITPPHLRAQVAAIYLFVSALGMLLGPPITGAFNEWVFPQAEGVRYSLVTVSSIFGVIGLILLQFARKPYAASLAAADR